MNGFGSASEELSYFVDALVLHDLPLIGRPFTFFRFGQCVTRSRIDRFIVFYGAGHWFSRLIQKAIFHFLFDHLPITASTNSLSSGYRPFKFFNVWYHDRSLGNLVAITWESSVLSHCPICDKFSRVK